LSLTIFLSNLYIDYIVTQGVPEMDKPIQRTKAGRPTKSDLAAVKKKPVGRPKGDAAAIEEFKARLLASPKSRQVIDAILKAALDDEHKNQSAAWKLLIDRMLPMSYFEKDKLGGSRPSVNITISGIGGAEPTIISDDYEDANDISGEREQD
jgi:hypothetical protein